MKESNSVDELVDVSMLNKLHSLEGKEVIVRLDEPEFEVRGVMYNLGGLACWDVITPSTKLVFEFSHVKSVSENVIRLC